VAAARGARVNRLELPRADDWHLHLRDGAALADIAKFSAARFARAIIMPNLQPPIATTELAGEYRRRILAALPADCDFEPLMTLYLTENTAPEEIDRAVECGFIHGVKLYPAGATTHSEAGVRSLRALDPVLARMQALGMPLLVHGESTDPDVDVFDREAHFIERQLGPLIERFPALKVVLEHITTARAVAFVEQARAGVAATITPQHLLENRNALFNGGIRPHYYCLPVLKRESDRQALIAAATGGNPRFFLGTDSAPHERRSKEGACGCAGIFTAHAALELYAEVFERAGRLDRLPAFAAHFGADFYGLPRNAGTVTLVKAPWVAPATYAFADGELVPYRAGRSIEWRVHSP
jgi:dihydroorotase